MTNLKRLLRLESALVRGRLRALLPPLLVAVLPLVFFSRVLLPIPSLAASFAHGDFIDIFYPFYNFVVRSYWAGHFPLWSPHIYGGHPAAADVQFASFYPPLLLVGLLTGPQNFSVGVLEATALLHLSLAAVGTYLFAHLHLRDRRAAGMSATAFVLGGYVTSFPIIQLAILEVSAWLPLTMWLVERGFRGRRFNFLLAGTVLAISFLAGHPQTSMYIVYLMAAYVTWRLLLIRSQGRQWEWGRVGVAGLLVVGPAIGLSAIQWLPSTELLGHSIRATLSYQEAALGLHPSEVAGLAVPVYGGNAAVYTGMLPLILSLVGLFLGRGRWRIFWASVALVAFLLAFGGNSPLFRWIYAWAPGFAVFRQQERSLFLYSFATAMLAGYGSRSLFTDPLDLRSPRTRLLGISLLALGGWLLWLGQGFPRGDGPAWSLYILNLSFYALGLAVIWVWVRSFTHGQKLYLAAWALVFLNLFLFNSSHALVPKGDPFPLLQAVRFIQTDPAAPFRISSEGLLPGDGNGAMVYDLEDIVGNTPLRLRSSEDFWSQVDDEWVKWNLYSVKYALTDRFFQRQGVVLARQEDGLYLYRLTDPMPRAYLVGTAWLAADQQQAAELLNSPDFDFRNMAVLEGDRDQTLRSGSSPEGSVEVLAQDPGHLLLEVRTPQEALLVISERYYPGWRAWLDGQEVELYRANQIFMALPVGPSLHQVELRFDPPSFRLGLAVSVLTLLAVLAILVGTMVTPRLTRWPTTKSTPEITRR